MSSLVLDWNDVIQWVCPFIFCFSSFFSKEHVKQKHKNNTLLFEGVCLTHVILAPGTCGRGVPTCGWWHLIAGLGLLTGLAGLRGWIPKSSKLLVYAVLEHPWPSQKRPEASSGHKSLTHIERSEISGYKLFGRDPTWGTCLEQSLCKINPGRA